jgi:hypothetical protein
MPIDANTYYFEAEADFVAASIPAAVTSTTTAGYYVAGDGGGHKKVRISTPSPIKAWHKQSADGAWWQISESMIRPQAFGAVADLVNHDEVYIQAAADYATTFKVPLLVLGTFRCYTQIAASGFCSVIGYGRNLSRIEFHASSSSFGIKLSASAQNDYLAVENVGVYTYGTSGIGIELDFSGQGANVYNIEQRGHIKNCTVSGNGSGLTYYFTNGIKITNCKDVLVESNTVVGGGGSTDNIAAAIGINFADAGYANSVSARIVNNTVTRWAVGVKTVNVEGVFVELNDVQDCDVASDFSNTTQKNQLRLINNHFGATKQSVKATSISFATIAGNEIYNLDIGVTTERVLVALQDVSGITIHSNRIRSGNSNNTRVGIDIVRSSTLANCFDIVSDGNDFFNIQTEVRSDANSVRVIQGMNNIRNLTGTTKHSWLGGSNISKISLGTGGQMPPSGSNQTLYVDNNDNNVLSLQRVGGTGVTVGFYQSGTLVGNISCTGSATVYATSSDYRLKENVVPLVTFELDDEDFSLLDDAMLRTMARRPVAYSWIAFPESGVQHGYLAHELALSNANAVTGEKGAMKILGTATTVDGLRLEEITESDAPAGSKWMKTMEIPEYQAVDYSKLVPDIDATLQSAIVLILKQQKEIDVLYAKLAKLGA